MTSSQTEWGLTTAQFWFFPFNLVLLIVIIHKSNLSYITLCQCKLKLYHANTSPIMLCQCNFHYISVIYCAKEISAQIKLCQSNLCYTNFHSITLCKHNLCNVMLCQCTGGSHLSHTVVKPDSCLAQIFVAKFLCIIKLTIIIG